MPPPALRPAARAPRPGRRAAVDGAPLAAAPRVGRGRPSAAPATLKRVANEKKNTKAAGRALAKIAHANPGAVFGVILTQVEAYDNLIAPIVDCLGCLTPLAYDVLAAALLRRLADDSRKKLQDDGMYLAHWFQNAATFAGLFYAKHSATELQGSLRSCGSRARPSLELSAQRAARAHGRRESVEDPLDHQLQARRQRDAPRGAQCDRPHKRAVLGLRKALYERGDGGGAADGGGGAAAGGDGAAGASPAVALPLLVLIAHQRAQIVHRDETFGAHLKLIARSTSASSSSCSLQFARAARRL